jgi:hypothetical protein
VNINKNIRVVGYTLTNDSDFMDEQNHMTPYLRGKIKELFPGIQKGKKSVVSKILKLIEKYPKNPHLKNYLSLAYINLGEFEKSEEINKGILKEHPDYLFGILNKAAGYLQRKEFDKIPKLLGENMELKELYPDREVFYVGEFTGFNKIAIQYFLETGNIEEAESRLNMLNEKFSNHPDTESVQDWFNNRLLEKGEMPVRTGKAREPNISLKEFPEPQTTENPVFVHHEIYSLYEFDLNIPQVFIENILALPRKSVIADLELALKDGISRYLYFEELFEKEKIGDERLTFPLHAILLLGELKAKQSLDKILKFLSYESDFLMFWLGDHKTETIYEALYYLGESQLLKLKEFMFKPNVDIYVKTAVSTAVQQIYLYQPRRKIEVIDWFENVIDFYIGNVGDKNVTDNELLGFIVSDIIGIREKRLLPCIERLYKLAAVNEEVGGSIQVVRAEINNGTNALDCQRDLLDIYNRYMSFAGTFLPKTKKQFDYVLRNSPVVPFDHRAEIYTKVDKKDLCPCGSGKQFGDCCMNRLN